MLFVIFGVPVGALLALRRYPVFSLAPVVALFAGGAIVTGIATSHDPRIIGIEVLGAIASTQLAYVAASLTVYLTLSSRLLPTVQAAIGQELGTAFEIPRGLPPEMAALVRKLQPHSSSRSPKARVFDEAFEVLS
jgi:hypothetical protein